MKILEGVYKIGSADLLAKIAKKGEKNFRNIDLIFRNFFAPL